MFNMVKSKVAFGAIPVVIGALLAFASCNDSSTVVNNSNNPTPANSLVNAVIVANAAGMGAGAYSPNPLEVLQGQTVAWTNADSVNHTVTASDGSFDSGNIAPAGVYRHTFDTVGTFDYFDTIFGEASMNGSVIVNPPPSPSPSPSDSVEPSPSPSVSPSPSPVVSASPSPLM